MIKVSVMYPNTADARFDVAYYHDKHMPMVRSLMGDACKKTTIDVGVGGAAPGAPAPYIAIGHLYFDSIEEFQGAFAAHAAEITSDVRNYTNAAPTFQISEIVG